MSDSSNGIKKIKDEDLEALKAVFERMLTDDYSNEHVVIKFIEAVGLPDKFSSLKAPLFNTPVRLLAADDVLNNKKRNHSKYTEELWLTIIDQYSLSLDDKQVGYFFTRNLGYFIKQGADAVIEKLIRNTKSKENILKALSDKGCTNEFTNKAGFIQKFNATESLISNGLVKTLKALKDAGIDLASDKELFYNNNYFMLYSEDAIKSFNDVFGNPMDGLDYNDVFNSLVFWTQQHDYGFANKVLGLIKDKINKDVLDKAVIGLKLYCLDPDLTEEEHKVLKEMEDKNLNFNFKSSELDFSLSPSEVWAIGEFFYINSANKNKKINDLLSVRLKNQHICNYGLGHNAINQLSLEDSKKISKALIDHISSLPDSKTKNELLCVNNSINNNVQFIRNLSARSDDRNSPAPFLNDFDLTESERRQYGSNIYGNKVDTKVYKNLTSFTTDQIKKFLLPFSIYDGKSKRYYSSSLISNINAPVFKRIVGELIFVPKSLGGLMDKDMADEISSCLSGKDYRSEDFIVQVQQNAIRSLSQIILNNDVISDATVKSELGHTLKSALSMVAVKGNKGLDDLCVKLIEAGVEPPEKIHLKWTKYASDKLSSLLSKHVLEKTVAKRIKKVEEAPVVKRRLI